MSLDELFADRDLADHLQVPVVLDTDAADRILRAEAAVEQTRTAHEAAKQAELDLLHQPQTEKAQQALDDAEDELAAAQEAAATKLYEFWLTSIGSLAWERLVGLHPPTKKQREDHGRSLDYNPETFPVAAVAACLTKIRYPDGTIKPTGHDVVDTDGGIDEAALASAVAAVRRTIKAKLKHGHWQQVWGAALRVNIGVSQVPSSLRGSNQARSSGSGSEPR